jgi:hypothetical protein
MSDVGYGGSGGGMDFATLGAAGISAGAGAYTNSQNISMQESTNAQNLAIAQAQMSFQERMSSTSHQREVADLRAAGLNPMLSGMGGSGASTPSGASATMVAPKLDDVVTPALNSAVAVKQVKQAADKISSDIEVNNSLRKLQSQQGDLAVSNSRAAMAKAQNDEVSASAARAQLPAIKARADFEAKHADKLAPIDAILDRLPLMHSGTSALKQFIK